MPTRTVTKSIRLTHEEARETSHLSALLSSVSEASLIKQAFRRGLMEMKLNAAVNRYTERDMSIGEVADTYSVSPADLAQELVRRRIPTMDVPANLIEDNLDRLLARHGLQPGSRRTRS